MEKNITIRVLATVVLALCSVRPSLATTTTWIGPSTGGVFNDDENWDANSPGDNGPLPQGPNDRAVFDTTIDGTITFDADATHQSTDIKSTGGTLTFDTGQYKWVTTNIMVVGDGLGLGAPGYPKIRHVGGYIEAFHFIMGNDETSPGASWEISGPTAHLHSIRGSGGLTLGNGPGGDGTAMWVHSGGKLTTLGQTILGLQGSSDCLLTIEGTGTVFSSGNYLGVGHTGSEIIGNATNNKAIIRDGATASASNLYMAITAGAPNNEIVITGPGTTFALTGVNGNDGNESTIGWRAPNNLLRIDDGAVVTGTNYFVIGNEAGSNAGNQIVLSNASLSATGMEPRRGQITITNGTLDMIQWFDEDLEVYKGGGVVAKLASAVFSFNSGTVRSVNADVTNGAAFTVGNGSANSATYFMRLDVAGNRGTHVFSSGLVLASNGILAGNGNVTANVSGAAGAKVDVGASAGLINVTGNWNNTGIGIALELDNIAASTTPGMQFDQLNVSGAFTHGGTVTIDRSQLVGPASATQLKLIGWGSQVGLNSATVVSFLGGSALPFAFQADGLYVTVQASVGGLPGDYNNNGTVDAADYTIYRNNVGQTTLTNRGTGITGPVGPADYAFWKTHFGEGMGSGAAAGAAIPEPGSACLVLGLVVFGLGSGRWNMHRMSFADSTIKHRS